MNDKLWKVIQISAPVSGVVIAVMGLLVSDFDAKPDGGWNIEFPSKGFQITVAILIGGLFSTSVVATYVRKEGEVSLLAIKRSIKAVIGWGLFFLLLRYSRYLF